MHATHTSGTVSCIFCASQILTSAICADTSLHAAWAGGVRGCWADEPLAGTAAAAAATLAGHRQHAAPTIAGSARWFERQRTRGRAAAALAAATRQLRPLLQCAAAGQGYSRCSWCWRCGAAAAAMCALLAACRARRRAEAAATLVAQLRAGCCSRNWLCAYCGGSSCFWFCWLGVRRHRCDEVALRQAAMP